MAILVRNSSVLSRRDATHPPEEKQHEGRQPEEGRCAADRMAGALNETFQRSSYPPLRRLHAKMDADVIELHGIVRSYYQKQIAQQAAMDLLQRHGANQELVNQIEVIR
ncbi:MAG TPA: hypothetical protein VGN57_06025 [Pirellulaceae bacterium]|jgi:hypothetical protein|nr:hypothetical protein [Pirellulaceae bacterium]